MGIEKRITLLNQFYNVILLSKYIIEVQLIIFIKQNNQGKYKSIVNKTIIKLQICLFTNIVHCRIHFYFKLIIQINHKNVYCFINKAIIKLKSEYKYYYIKILNNPIIANLTQYSNLIFKYLENK